MAEPGSNDEPLYPPEHAFVVQFSRDAVPAGSACRGRVEHIPSGRSARFEDAQSLLAFMDRLLARSERRGPSRPYPHKSPRRQP